ncbi:MAG: 3-isopropylmalate dehydrogenase [Omnitrophica bacterium RIFCSPHIGHO2_02_FULL_46_11]|nr:MAG: 3-isopropylmalate dehydrogenase [Omnitrophica bacterium RIFCSPHIGHO2_02_FULL_46_11]OGW87588.1 MAG: 3-isopropylmalate dehydrogenase [Omnitrophica bacterium RIFCSPLOWO2_01_FULL_45_10b]
MYKILVLPGDGIGEEVVCEALKVLKRVESIAHLKFETKEALVGGASIDKNGVPITEDVLKAAKNSDAVLLGAVGGQKWDQLEYKIRPEQALLALRKELGLYANLRPVAVDPSLTDASSLKREVIEGVDILVVRELTGGIYFGTPKGIEKNKDGSERGFNTEVYSTHEIERIAKKAFELARKRKRKITSVDKANILESSILWRKVVTEIGKRFPDVQLSHIYVDNCAMQLIRNPKQFDVIVTTNLFGDILSDEAAMLTGSIGMLPSASLGDHHALYEPVHGSAPDIAGKGQANPIAAILSVAMMLRCTFQLHDLALAVEMAVRQVLKEGFRTADICQDGVNLTSCSEMGNLVAKEIKV